MVKKFLRTLVLGASICSIHSASGAEQVAGQIAADFGKKAGEFAMAQLSGVISAQTSEFTSGIGYGPVRIRISNNSKWGMVLQSVSVSSGKIVSRTDHQVPPELLYFRPGIAREFTVSSRVAEIRYGAEGSMIYSPVEGTGRGWTKFTWDCGLATGDKLIADTEAGGGIKHVDRPGIIITHKQTGSGLNGLSYLDVEWRDHE